jgi:hypothetical protein
MLFAFGLLILVDKSAYESQVKRKFSNCRQPSFARTFERIDYALPQTLPHSPRQPQQSQPFDFPANPR